MPIRVRLVAGFAAAMCVLMVGGGFGVHAAVAHSLDRSIDQGLRARIDDLATAVASADGIPDRPLVSEESTFAQVLGEDGSVLASSERFAGEPVLTRRQVAQALRAPIRRERGDDGQADAVRLLATRATRDGRPIVVVVGTSLELRRRTLHDLAGWLYLGGAVGTVIATLLGYVLSARALGAMEQIRRAAEQIDHRSLGSQLPVPVARDEMRALTITLNELLKRIDAAFERERQFIGDASHELRTPVALLKTELEIALLEPYDVDDLEAARSYIDMLRARVQSAEAEADRLGQLATSLLLVAREDDAATQAHGAERVGATRIDVRAALELVRTRFEGRAAREDRGLVLDVDELAGDAAVMGDAVRFEQACSNLVDNALRHGSGDVRIEARDGAGGAVEVRVADGGAGIDPADRDAAFERFSRGRETAGGDQGGAGLGLAIVRMVVEAQGGMCRIDDGGRVVLSLPGC